jgi:cytochrome c-type biogenesis protein CcmF
VYEPAINRFGEGNSAIGTPSVRTTPTRDVWLALLQVPDEDNAGRVVVRVLVQPLVVWLWIGGAVMLAGTALAAFPGRRRNPVEPVSAPSPRPADRPADPAAVAAGGLADGGPAAPADGRGRAGEEPVEVRA